MKITSTLRKSAFAIAVITLASSCTSNNSKMESGDREPAAVRYDKAVSLSNSDIQKSASSGALKVSNAHLIIDNDEAFFSKYNAIDKAVPGDTIRMVYYIFSGDESSSYLIQKLIEKAKSGVKVKLMLDLITNYKNLDLLSYIEKEGNGNIEVALYGRPSPYVVRDSLFMTKPCPVPSARPKPTDCADAKWSEVQKLIEAQGGTQKVQDFYMNLFLAGLYGRDGASAKVSFNYGSQVADAQGQSGPVSADQKKKLRELIRLVLDAKIFNEESAYIKLGLAMVLYASEVNPVLNQLYGRFPFEQPGKESSFEHWEHLTDYTHHKLLLVGPTGADAAFMQLGGRNIENSYHMKLNTMSAKYTFMDTDFAAQVSVGASKVAESYDKMWNYKEVVITLKEIKSFLNNDYARNPQALLESVKACEIKGLGKKRDEMAQCLAAEVVKNPSFKTLETRMANEAASIKTNSARYVSGYYSKLDRRSLQSWKGTGYQASVGGDSRWSTADESSAAVFYLENLPYTRNSGSRTLNFDVGQEYDNNKNIHDLWLKGLQSVCAAGEPKRVILHSAYWFPATNMMETFLKMINGTWDCSKVTVQIVTNSFETTDLNVLNVFARYQMRAFYKVYDEESDSRRRAKFEYYEYKPGKGATASQVLSLHTKMSVLGDDVIIGSANADIRSYMMDSNNAVFVRGAKDFVKNYNAWMDGILKDPAQIAELSNQFRLPLGMSEDTAPTGPVFQCSNAAAIFQGQAPMPMNLHAQDMCFLEGLAMKFKFLGNMKVKQPDNWLQLQELERAIGYNIWDSTISLMSDKRSQPSQELSTDQQRRWDSKIKNDKLLIRNSFNRKYQTF